MYAGIVEDHTWAYLLGHTQGWTLGQLLMFSELLVLHLKNGDNSDSQD